MRSRDSVLPPLGEELRPDHPLLGRKRARTNENESLISIALYRYIVLGTSTSTSFVTKFANVSTIRRCFLNVHSTYMLYPLHNQETPVCVLQLYIFEKLPVVR